MAPMKQPQSMDALPAPVSSEEEWTVGTLMTVLRRRRLMMRAILIMLLLAVSYCVLATPRYKATGEIQIQKEAAGEFGLESSVMGRDDNSVSSDSLDYNITLQTTAGILQSDALALVVIRDLHLEDTHDYFPLHPTPSAGATVAGLLGHLMFWRMPLEPLSVPLAQAPNRRYKALKIFAGHLKVEPVPGTRLIDISYSDPDPVRSAAVVNRLIAELGDFTFQQRFTSTQQGSAWLTTQLSDLKRQMQDLQARAIGLQRGTGMFGNDASRNVVLERLESLNQTLAQAESNRILKEAIDRVAASGDPELISSLGGNASPGATGSTANSLTLVQSLRTREAALRAELAEDSVRYGPAYPKLGELQAQLAGVNRSIQEEVHRLGERAHSDYLVAAREEAGARSAGYVLLRLPLEIKDLFREWLEAARPDRARKVMSLVRQMRGGLDYDARWGSRMKGQGPIADLLSRRFGLACERLGLNRTHFSQRTDLFRPPLKSSSQMELFG